MKKRFIFVLLLIFLCSCSSKEYTDMLSASTLTASVSSDLLSGNGYVEYTEEDVKYSFSCTALCDSYSVIYSLSADDIGEVGIFKARNTDELAVITEDLRAYISDLKKDKSEFLKSYLPSELEKLDGSEVRTFGSYAVYTILSPEDSEATFSFLDRLLQK
jgi:hypothetical protein